MLKGLIALVLLLATAILACQMVPAAPGPQEPATPTPAPEPAKPAPQPAATPKPEPPVPAEARSLVDLAKSDLSQRKAIPKEQIGLVSLEEVDWPNGSLGYPKPGMVYIQVIIPGYRVILSDGTNTYEYHTDKGQRIELGER